MKTPPALTALLLAATPCASCLSANIIHGATESRSAAQLDAAKGRLGARWLPSSADLADNQDNVRAWWGDPDDVDAAANETIWSYDGDVGFAGAFFVAFVVPIPIIVPTGHRLIRFHFIDERLVSVDREFDGSSGCVAGLAWAHRWRWVADCYRDAEGFR